MLIYNANIATMTEKGELFGYVITENGKITDIGAGEPPTYDGEKLDADGGLLLPGFIDAHSHIGIIGDGVGYESDDSNEEHDNVTPQLRTLDAINPFDRCLNEAFERGVTTCVVAPGSANPIGGQVSAIKTYGECADDMLIRVVGMKLALGENPKSVYGKNDETPATRMTTAAIIREALFKAQRYMDDCDAAEKDSELDPPDFDIKHEALMPLLRRELKAHFHCHRNDDIFTALRLAREFNLDAVLVHCTEGYLTAERLAKENAQVVVGPIISDRCKPELRGLSVNNAAKLAEAGVRLAICTDHPVIPEQYLPLSARCAISGGLDRNAALRALTCDAAAIAGISDRVGSIAVGLDSDLQLYPRDADPLDVITAPRVFVGK